MKYEMKFNLFCVVVIVVATFCLNVTLTDVAGDNNTGNKRCMERYLIMKGKWPPGNHSETGGCAGRINTFLGFLAGYVEDDAECLTREFRNAEMLDFC